MLSSKEIRALEQGPPRRRRSNLCAHQEAVCASRSHECMELRSSHGNHGICPTPGLPPSTSFSYFAVHGLTRRQSLAYSNKSPTRTCVCQPSLARLLEYFTYFIAYQVQRRLLPQCHVAKDPHSSHPPAKKNQVAGAEAGASHAPLLLLGRPPNKSDNAVYDVRTTLVAEDI